MLQAKQTLRVDEEQRLWHNVDSACGALTCSSAPEEHRVRTFVFRVEHRRIQKPHLQLQHDIYTSLFKPNGPFRSNSYWRNWGFVFFNDTHTENMWLGNPAFSPVLAYLIIGFKCCNSSMEFLWLHSIWSYILLIKNPWIHGIKKCIRANHNWGTQTALYWGFRQRTKGAQIDLLWSVCVSAETNHHKLHTAK